MGPDRAPQLHLDFQEELFEAAWKRLRRGVRDPDAALLVEEYGAASALLQAFAGRRVALRRAESSGGCRGDVALLPEAVALGDRAGNRDFLFLRAAVTGAMLAEGFPGAGAAAEDEAAFLLGAAQVLRGLAARHAGFAGRLAAAASLELAARPAPEALRPAERGIEEERRRFLEAARRGFRPVASERLEHPAPAAAAPRGWLARLRRRPSAGPLLLCGGPLGAADREAAEQAQAALDDDPTGVAAGASEVQAPAKDRIRRLMLEQEEAKEDMPETTFEKVSFAERYSGSQRRFDAEDDMDEHQDSLDAVDLREVLRGGPEAQSVYRAEVGLAGTVPEVDDDELHGRAVRYDEWDHGRRGYRRGWATVLPTATRAEDRDWAAARRAHLMPQARLARMRLEKLRTERLLVGRQLDGDEIDLVGLVEEHAERRAGRSPAGKLYLHRPRVRRDLATTVLLDISLSADSWVDDRRVLDLERDAAWVLGEVAHDLGDSLQLLAFSSNTRNRCRVWTLKDWREPWPRCAARLGALAPQGYTRIGPALRHATAQLAAHPARHKHLILVTDAKPNDFDRYEGEYGIQDVRQAVLEARRMRVSVHALGIDPRAGTTLPVMFGVGRWRIVRCPTELPQALLAAYGGTG